MTVHDTLPNGYPFTELYKDRRSENQDLVVLISDRQNRRGTGKTIFSLKLAHMMDQTSEGITKEKVAIDPEELAEAYIEQPKGSALVLDEAEAGLSKYEAGTAVNKAMRELVSMGRVREKYLVLNLPASSELDRDLKALCDFWFMVQRKGTAKGHYLNWNPYKERPYTPGTKEWNWSDIPEDHSLREVYDYLHQAKLAHLHGESDQSSQRISASEAKEMLEEGKKEAQANTRNKLLAEFYDRTELTQRELAEVVDLSRSRVADILSDQRSDH